MKLLQEEVGDHRREENIDAQIENRLEFDILISGIELFLEKAESLLPVCDEIDAACYCDDVPKCIATATEMIENLKSAYKDVYGELGTSDYDF